ncbi:single-stranded-DNA-specific exonuclease RecJ [Candidatus Roizmanbacteria bacterium]|nr:single-stranded-DNA-specific exonuclease RecJ [Candidatus Roizmanbacteria bacterium]
MRKWKVLNQTQKSPPKASSKGRWASGPDQPLAEKLKTQNHNLKVKVAEIISILLNNRGFKSKKAIDEFLNPSLDHISKYRFFDTNSLEKAIQRIKKAIEKKEQVIVYSDYDADGITGAAILWETFDTLGADAYPYVPNRMEEGYGLSKKGIDNVRKDYPNAKLIITVDHGITAVEQTAYAKEKGFDIVITDHHTLPKKLPKAYAIIHTTELAGSGVAYVFSKKCSDAIHGVKNKGAINRITTDLTNDHLALAAIGTISDLVPLIGHNRVIAKFGLEVLNNTKRIGLLSLFEESGLLGRPIGTYEVGFMIGPRINASGRLTHALDALRLLCTKSPKRAELLAKLLNQTNLDRQSMLQIATQHAKTLVSSEKKLLFIAHESYHEGVIGLVASKLVEEYYRPAIVLSKGEMYSKASARSINGFNIVEAIRTCSDILVNVGGHPMAAGFTVETSKLIVLEKRLVQFATEQIRDAQLERELRIDTELSFSDISWELYDAIKQFEPFGIGNPEPVFISNDVAIVDARVIGRDNNHLKLKVKQHHSPKGVVFDAIGFGKGELYAQLSPDKPISIAYSLSANEWNGNTSLQLKLKDLQ